MAGGGGGVYFLLVSGPALLLLLDSGATLLLLLGLLDSGGPAHALLGGGVELPPLGGELPLSATAFLGAIIVCSRGQRRAQ